MNNDLISREALKKQLKAKIDLDQDDEFTRGYNIGISACVELIDNAPSVEVYTCTDLINENKKGFNTARRLYERPQGEWNYIQAGMCVCPFCGATPHKEYKNFCAKCGADMRPQTHIRPKDDDETWKEDMQRDADAYYESQDDDE